MSHMPSLYRFDQSNGHEVFIRVFFFKMCLCIASHIVVTTLITNVARCKFSSYHAALVVTLGMDGVPLSSRKYQPFENWWLQRNEWLQFVPGQNSMTPSLSYLRIELWKKKPAERFTGFTQLWCFATSHFLVLVYASKQ